MPIEPHTPHTVDALLRVVAARDAEVVLLRLMVDKLKLQLLRRQRDQFGSSSEQLGAQLPLIAAEPAQTLPSAVVALQPRREHKARQAPRKLPEHLPRETLVHHPEGLALGTQCACAECGGKLRQLGEDVSEQLEYVPASFKVIRHVRPKLACVRCERIFQADAPSRPIARGLAGPGLLAQVLVAKYCDHLPLYRQSRIYAREGVEIDRSTMVDWVGQCSALLDPLVAALGRYTLAASKVHTDDTPVKVLDPGRGKTKTARLWVYVRDDRPAGSVDPPAAWYQYSPDRRGERPQAHLPSTAASCRPTVMRDTPSCMRAAASSRRRAGRTPDATSGTCTRARSAYPARWPSRRCSASPSCTRSRPTSAGKLPSSDADNARSERDRCCSGCTPG